MITIDKEFVEFVEKEIVSCVMKFSNKIEQSKAIQISNDIVNLIDWENSALMHKGISWITKNYLLQHKMI